MQFSAAFNQRDLTWGTVKLNNPRKKKKKTKKKDKSVTTNGVEAIYIRRWY